jgi:HTH-type transcriptional regulator/antitoxin HigA
MTPHDFIAKWDGADETHPLAGLAVMLGNLVSAWEHTHYPMPPEMSGVEVLRFRCTDWLVCRLA